MPGEVVNSFMLVSRYAEPPAEETLAQTLSAAGLGAVTATPVPAQERDGPRRRIAVYRLSQPGGPGAGRITVVRHSRSALDGMGEGAFNALTRRLPAEDAQTLRVGVLEMSLRLAGPDEATAATLRWGMGILRALLSLTQGAVVDPAAQTAWSQGQIGPMASGDLMAQVVIHSEGWGADSHWLHTHGLQKFGRPELDVVAVPAALVTEAQSFLLEVAESLARGQRLAAGQEIDFDDLGKVVAVNVAPDLDHQAPTGRLRLADSPLPGERQSAGAGRLLQRMALAEARRLRESGDGAALDAIERALAVDSDDCDALSLKADILLQMGQPLDALAVGELMRLRRPADYRGSLTVGLALLELRRWREALNALDLAIEREPEAAAAFAARAEAYRSLGDERLAAVDRARAAYLGV